MRLKASKTAVAAAAAIALTVGVAYAAIPGSDGVIHGCYTKSTGSLRVIDAETATCKASEEKIQWNQQGPAGPIGDTGPQGPSGATGPAGPPGDGNIHWARIAADGQVLASGEPDVVVFASEDVQGDYDVWFRFDTGGIDPTECATVASTDLSDLGTSAQTSPDFMFPGAVHVRTFRQSTITRMEFSLVLTCPQQSAG